MTNVIRHRGIVESIKGSHLTVRIVQASACASCHIKGHCSSADTKEKTVDVFTEDASSYALGDQVEVIAQLSTGVMAVLLAFVFPFLILLISLFLFMAFWNDEALAALASLGLLIPYYYILWLNKRRMGKKFSFSIAR